MTLQPIDIGRAQARIPCDDGLALDAIARSVNVSVMSSLRWRRDDALSELDPVQKTRILLGACLVESASPEGRMLEVRCVL